VKFSQYAKQQGMSYSTALRWWHQGVIRGYQAPSGTIIVETEGKQAASEERVAIYARVSEAQASREPGATGRAAHAVLHHPWLSRRQAGQRGRIRHQ